MLRNSKMFFWEWRKIHFYFHNLPIKQPSYTGGNCKTFHWTSWGVFVQIKRGENKIIFMSRSCGRNQLGHSLSSCSLRKQWIKNRKNTPKMKRQLFRTLLLPFQGHFCVTCLLFSCDNPGIKEKAAFQSRKLRKAAQFPFPSALFSWLICEHRAAFSTGFLWNSSISLSSWEDGVWLNWSITAASVEDVLTGFPWQDKGVLKDSFPFSALLSINPCREFISGED